MWSSAVKVHPWVGEYYENPKRFLHRTLILGESNFTELEKFGKDLVKDCVENDMSTDPQVEKDTTGFCRFSTKIRRIIFGREETLGPRGLWEDVAFYNFVQTLVGEKSRIRPTQEMWTESVPAFAEIVSVLKPERILVLGKANWRNLLTYIGHDLIDDYSATFNLSGRQIVAGYVNHPSSSLSYDEWQPVAEKLLLSE
jgi:hypothetical protein